ncbi:uncharacterized protein LOC142557221 isoform X3 [Dermacentor variabilis]|uniref:uncharacterized protein LOC142557221 isoform X3 n=1 Tax=Dermacentor variabilis TaxID=34621 RepID=UPI003F5B8659
MEEREQGSSPTKPKCPFKKQVWFETSMLGKQRVPVDSMKNKCRELLQVAQGRVIARDPDMDAKSKDLLVDTSEQILSSLDKGLQLRVFDPDKVVDLVHRKRPLAKEVRARCEHLEQRIRRAEICTSHTQMCPECKNSCTKLALKANCNGISLWIGWISISSIYSLSMYYMLSSCIV